MRLAPAFALLAGLLILSACDKPAETPVDAVEVAPVPTTVMPADAPPQEEVDPGLTPAAAGIKGSCLSEVGAAASARLVERCIQVSPATHPPCNVQNSCALIQGEIDRSCAMFGPDETRPPECTA
ncbi:hypothetical protein [uncultured Brevundimonas sp.]|uniref:hypothetical protein n=1 Tax=uncultured Brevundimonas sp. TaxID=213418 RepID=UPI0030EDD2C9|tara:strand:- start:36098 stop:36472 length:375 start_codon:yes stop_codon:yes gene_type:complete